MKAILVGAVVSVFLVFLVLFSATLVYACECKPTTFDERLVSADVVFQGTIIYEPEVVSLKRVATFSGIDVFKKPPSEFRHLFDGPNVTVSTGIDSGVCGADFFADNTYIVFAKIIEEKIETSICGGTTLITNFSRDEISYLQNYEALHDPYSDDEALRLASEKKFLSEETMGGGSGMGFFDASNFGFGIIVAAILIGAGSGIGLTIYWKKKKKN